LTGSAEAQVIGGGVVKRLLIAYFIGNISAKKYQNPFMCVKVIARQTRDFFETRCINVSFEEKINTTHNKEVTENSDASSKNLKSNRKTKLRRCRNVVEKSQSQSKKFDAIDVRLYRFGETSENDLVLITWNRRQ